MALQHAGFVGEIWSKFPELPNRKKVDNSVFAEWDLEGFIKAGYINFEAGRKELYVLSMMLEEYAIKNRKPLVASFEKESLFKYVEPRYRIILKTIPKSWIIGNFNNPYLAQDLPQTAQVLSCVGTSLVDVWTVITRGSHGPFGLYAEEFEKGSFKGFFSISPIVFRHVLKTMGDILNTKMDLDDWTIDRGGY